MSFDRACRSLSRKNSDYVELRDRHGRLKFEPQSLRSPFESLVRAISHQQLHANAAEAILGRMISKFSPKPFLSPEELLSLTVLELRECGYSESKVKALRDIASKTIDGTVPSAQAIGKLSDEKIVERLTQIYGVGRWTVEMLLIFQLGRMDVWPVDDFGVQKGFQVFKRKRQMPKKKHLHSYGEIWAPYRTVAALYFWREADLAKQLAKAKAKAKTKGKPGRKKK